MFYSTQQALRNTSTEGGSERTEQNSNSVDSIQMFKDQAEAVEKGAQPMQMLVKEEEEKSLQKKVAQKQGREEDEKQLKPVQKQEEEEIQAKQEEEELQAKMVQKQEEEEMQMKQSSGKSSSGEGRSSGTTTSMPEDVQAKMENSFGTSFGGVNIHQNDESATQMGALAYTQGNNVHFAPGQYNPSSQKGQELLGHELTHVVQQREGRVQPTKQGKGMSVNDSPALEHEADVMGKKAAEGKRGDFDQSQQQNTERTAIQRKTPQEKVKEFQSKTYSKENFSPSTGSGLFDVSLNPKNGRLEVKVNVAFSFVDGNVTKFTGLTGQSHLWSDTEKAKWKKDFITLIEGRWGGNYHFINSSLPGMNIYVDVEVEEVATDWHYQLNVTKIPKGSFKGSSIAHYVDSSGNALKQKNKHYGTLDSEDLNWADKGATEKQKGAIHEFGHMIGLGDEYNDGTPGIDHAAMVQSALGKVLTEGKTNDIMSSGNSIEKQHYITFLDALRTITSDNTWKYKP